MTESVPSSGIVRKSAFNKDSLQASPRPLPIRLFNAGGNGMARLGLRRRLRAESLMRSAQRKTGLHDFGPDDFREPLERLIESVETEAPLNPFGRMITRIRLEGVLSNRLRAQYWFDKHPKILEAELLPPLVITGLQRSGTTLLHRLLAALPGSRALLSWEALNPAPIPGKYDGDASQGSARGRSKRPDPRIAQARLSERAVRYMSPEFFAIHPVEHLAPEEEVLLLDSTFLSTVPEATMHVPSFAAWVENADQRPAYEAMRRFLLLLQWQRGGERWILKTPHHLEFIDTLFEVLPEARLIQTHRDPAVTLTSFCSMVYHSRRIFSDRVDQREVGDHWSRKVLHMIERAQTARSRLPEGQFTDLHYSEFAQDPVFHLRKLSEFADFDWDDACEDAAQKALLKNPRNKYGRHHYHPADFGLDLRKIRSDFSPYLEHFGVALESD